MLVRIANREDPYQTGLRKQSDLGLPCLSKPFWQVTSVPSFRTFTVTFFVLMDFPITTEMFKNSRTRFSFCSNFSNKMLIIKAGTR